MRWHATGPLTIRTEEVADVHAEITADVDGKTRPNLTIWSTREGVRWRREERFPTLGDAKAAALPLMRAAVIAARDEAHNAVLDASRWLRANGGEP